MPAWLRAAPLRSAVVLFALTLPLTATSWASGGGAEGAGPSDVAAASEASLAADPVASPTVTPTPRPTAAPRATPTATARPTPTVAPTREPTVTVGGDVSVHFLDVGQGDATLFMAPDATMLIDTGRHDRSDVVPLLRSLGVTTLDVVAITHAHADHIGQLDRVLDGFEVGEVWMSGTSNTTQTFDRAITALEGSSARYEEPRAGDTTTVGSLTVEILSPVGLTGDLHGDGLAVRVTYGSVSFLFTGDIESAGESAIVARRGALATTVYQVGHHGSSNFDEPGIPGGRAAGCRHLLGIGHEPVRASAPRGHSAPDVGRRRGVWHRDTRKPHRHDRWVDLPGHDRADGLTGGSGRACAAVRPATSRSAGAGSAGSAPRIGLPAGAGRHQLRRPC